MKQIVLVLFCGLFFSCDATVNTPINVADGEVRQGSLNSVNGGIFVGERCEINGGAKSVNGPVEVGKKSRIEGIQSVNGPIRLQDDVTVKGDIGAVNGPVDCMSGVLVSGSIETVNGPVNLTHAKTRRNIETVNGHITLRDGAIVQGDIRIEGNKSKSGSQRPLVIRLEGESVVEGNIIVEDDDREVEVYLIDGSQVKGEIRNATVMN